MVGDINPEEFARRVSFAQSYYRALGNFLRGGSLRKALAEWSSLEVSAKFALLHPELYREQVSVEAVLGPRSFGAARVAAGSRCMCEQLWGYTCEFVGRPMHQDHKFPYALGGATDPDNLLTLCEVHNFAKGHDIHIYPWPSTTPPWVDAALQRLAHHYPRCD